ncbi:uncharacterized protein LOC129283015 [Lytechinus pictus]|uniref:uncharacterized protein LOC129283015 n=1 Tax=Lytechinus pictus TaxID=7653 RepID=UPI0030BA00BF
MKSHPEEAHYYQESVNKERHTESKVSADETSEDVTMSQDEKREQNKQNKTQTQAAESDEGHTDEKYDLIQIEKHGITVRISKYEIYSAKDITVEVIEEVPPELKLNETEAIISVGLKMSPSDAIFDSPVRVTMPHCGAFTKPTDAEVYIYYRKNDSTKFTAILSTSTSIPKCVVRDRDLDIYLEHFSEFWITATIRKIFIGKVVICTPIIPVPAPRNLMPVVWVNVRDQNNAEGQIPKEYKAPIPEEQFLFRWRSGGLKISCKESTLKDEPQILQEREFRHLSKHKKMFEVDTQNITENAVNLHITLQQNTTKNTLIVPMSLKATVISEGGACSPSTIATSSSSAGNHPAEVIHSGSTSETRMKSPEEAHCYQESVNKERHKESEVSADETSEDVTMSQDEKREQNKQNKTQTQAAESDEGHTDEEYDLIQIEKHGITVRISKYEIYSAKDITVEVIEEVPPEIKLKETEAIISVGLKMSPSDAVFDSPVRVTMPHCGGFTKPTDAEVYIYYRKNGTHFLFPF